MLSDRQFRHLSRADLIEVIYQLQSDEDELRAENESLRAQLEDRRLRLESAGSIAEASLALSGVFEAAQAAADAYLAELKARVETDVVKSESTVKVNGETFSLSSSDDDSRSDVGGLPEAH